MQRARQANVVDVVPGRLGQRPLLAPARHASVHQLLVASPAILGPQPQALGDARAEPLEEGIRLLDKAQHGFSAGGAFKVDGD